MQIKIGQRWQYKSRSSNYIVEIIENDKCIIIQDFNKPLSVSIGYKMSIPGAHEMKYFAIPSEEPDTTGGNGYWIYLTGQDKPE